jgi:hypothetical protein
MRISRPNTGTILGAIALFIALGGTALAAGATVVNIADPTTPANVAHVNSSGQLSVAGPVSVTSTITTELAAPSTYIHTAAFDLSNADSCQTVATPPTGKAMIVREVRVDVGQDPSPGVNQNVVIYGDAMCSGNPIADVNPATVGETTLPFDPGLGIPAKSGLSVFVNGSVVAEVYADGYSVSSATVPTSAATVTTRGTPKQ